MKYSTPQKNVKSQLNDVKSNFWEKYSTPQKNVKSQQVVENIFDAG